MAERRQRACEKNWGDAILEERSWAVILFLWVFSIGVFTSLLFGLFLLVAVAFGLSFLAAFAFCFRGFADGLLWVVCLFCLYVSNFFCVLCCLFVAAVSTQYAVGASSRQLPVYKKSDS